MKQIISDYPKMIDLFLFMGQSNMAGRGEQSREHPEGAPELISGAGYEYRAISAPGKLFPIVEPFGGTEDNIDGIYDPLKSGSLVSAFVNEWYRQSKVPIVGVSASKGGSSILKWQENTPYYLDAKNRVKSAIDFLEKNNISIRHKYLLWCQGETDGDKNMDSGSYEKYFDAMLDKIMTWGIEHCYMIKIGHYNGSAHISYEQIRLAQENIAQNNPYVTICSRLFGEMKDKGLMKDEFHYFQEAYNCVGYDAARNILTE